MPWREPEYEGEFPSLGWLVLGWFLEYLPSPADETKPLVLTDEQAGIVVRWYRLDPKSGKFLYRRGCMEMAKGWGKSPLAAAISLAEFAGPVLFDGWDAHGEPVGRSWGTEGSPPPWVQIAAVSEDQTDNTYAALYEMLVANHNRAAEALGIDQGRTRLYLKDRAGAKLEPVTAAAGSREGQRVTFGILDETHLWTPMNGGVKLARTIRRNAAKMKGRSFETTNAPELGIHSVAEQTGKDARLGEPGILYYARRPKVRPEPDWTDEQLLDALGSAFGDAWWIDLDRLVQEMHDGSTAWTDALRFSFNTPVPAGAQWEAVRRWPACRKPKRVPKGARVALGFSGSYDGRTAGLVGCTSQGHLFVIDAWEREEGLSVPRSDVSAAVARAMKRYDVAALGCNPPGWDTDVEEWAERWGSSVVIGWEVRKRAQFTQACGKFLNGVVTGDLTHDGDTRLELHLENALPKKSVDGEGIYITDNGNRSATIAKAAVIAYELGFEAKSKEPLVAWA